jgi:hypothetical protein
VYPFEGKIAAVNNGTGIMAIGAQGEIFQRAKFFKLSQQSSCDAPFSSSLLLAG